MDAVRDKLGSMKLESVAQGNAGMLKKVSETTSVADAVAMLREHNILSVPVIGADGRSFSGCFSITDVLKMLVRSLRLENRRQSFDMRGNDAARALQGILDAPVREAMHAGDLWYMQGQDATVLDAVKDMLQRRAVHHRLFICKTMKETSPTAILSQSDIVKLIWEHKSDLGDVRTATVESLGLCAVRFASAGAALAAAETVPAAETTMQVFVDMWRDRKTCMGLTATSEPGSDLVGNVSLSDLRALTADKLGLLSGPIGAFVLAIRGYTPPDDDSVNWSEALRAVPVHIVTPSTRFEQVLELLVVHKLHRAYVHDDKEHAIGVITLTDVLRQLLPKVEETPTEGPAMGLPHSSEAMDEQEENGVSANGAAAEPATAAA